MAVDEIVADDSGARSDGGVAATVMVSVTIVEATTSDPFGSPAETGQREDANISAEVAVDSPSVSFRTARLTQ